MDNKETKSSNILYEDNIEIEKSLKISRWLFIISGISLLLVVSPISSLSASFISFLFNNSQFIFYFFYILFFIYPIILITIEILIKKKSKYTYYLGLIFSAPLVIGFPILTIFSVGISINILKIKNYYLN